MADRTLLLLTLPFFCLLCGVARPVTAADEEKLVFETWSGQKIEAFRGSFNVPENRNAADSRTIPIRYVRLPSTGNDAGPPIVYLAGGPGGSGIEAINYRYRMFMAMRAYGDVIALDQRGTGASSIVPECRSSHHVPTSTEVSDRDFVALHRAALTECLAFWRREGVDLAGYDTVQNALDLEALRRHLGADRIILWGTSYGSTLALAALREIDGSIARVVLSSVEGLDQAIKLPARTDAYFDRLQHAIDSRPDAKAAYPDIEALMRRVHAKLEHEPLPLQLKTRDGETFEYLLQRRDMQIIAAGLIADPESAARLLEIYLALDRGIEPTFEHIPARLLPDGLIDPGRPISFDAMAIATDLASGMTAERKLTIAEQAKAAILGSYLNFTFHLDGIAPELDLGDDFRAKPASDTPTLVFSGTLDGRTYIESQREALSELEHVTIITVRNAGHNLFDEPTSEMLEIIDRFMEGGRVDDATIAVELADMAPKSFP